MNDFNAIATEQSRTVLTVDGEPVTFRGAGGDVPTVAVIEAGVDAFGVDAPMGQTIYVVALLTEDTGTPRRGDLVITADTDPMTYALEEVQPGSDQWVSLWSASKR